MEVPSKWKKYKLKYLVKGHIRNGYSPVCESINGTCGWVLSLGSLTPQGLDYTQRKVAPVDLRLQRVKLHDNDILISRSNTPDRVGMSSIFHAQKEDYFYPDLMMRFQLNSEKILPLWGWYFLNLPSSRSYFKQRASGTSSSMVKITSTTVNALEILCPPLLEQQRIAELLGTWDEAIEKLERLIAMQAKKHSHLANKLLFSETGKPVKIATIAQEVSRKASNSEELTVLSCTKYDGLVESEEYFGRRVYGTDLSKYKAVPQGCFVYATNHIEEGSIGLQNQYELALISPMYTVFSIDAKQVDPCFLFYLLKSPHYIKEYKKRTEGSIARRGGLRWNSFAKIEIRLPEIEKQVSIATMLRYSKYELDLLRKELTALQKQKRGLMQKLLTGTWKV